MFVPHITLPRTFYTYTILSELSFLEAQTGFHRTFNEQQFLKRYHLGAHAAENALNLLSMAKYPNKKKTATFETLVTYAYATSGNGQQTVTRKRPEPLRPSVVDVRQWARCQSLGYLESKCRMNAYILMEQGNAITFHS